jgi:WD40 repeat protein
VFGAGAHVARFDLSSETMAFLPRDALGREVTAMTTVPARDGAGGLLFLAEFLEQSQVAQVVVLGIEGDDRPPVLLEPGRVDPAHMARRIISLGASQDGSLVLSLTAAPECTLTLWEWAYRRKRPRVRDPAVDSDSDGEEKFDLDPPVPIARASCEVALLNLCTVTSAQLGPGHVSLSGNQFLRLWSWQLEEQEELLPLGKELLYDFVGHCWVQTGLVAATRDGMALVFIQGELRQQVALGGCDEWSCITNTKEGFAIGGKGAVSIFAQRRQKAVLLQTVRTPQVDIVHSISCSPNASTLILFASVYTGAVPQRRRASAIAQLQPVGSADKPKTGFELFTCSIDGSGELKPVYPRSFHRGPVHSLSVAYARRAFATVGEDSSVRVWTYQGDAQSVEVDARGRSLSTTFRDESMKAFPGEFPCKVAVHPCGFHVAVTFPDRVRLFHVAADGSSQAANAQKDEAARADAFKIALELPLKLPGDVVFSHSGTLLCVTSGTQVLLLDPWRAVLIQVYAGHLQPISQVVFSDDDEHVLSAGQDGCVYGWRINGSERIFEHVQKGQIYLQLAHDIETQTVAAVTSEGHLRYITHGGALVDKELGGPSSDVQYTSLCLSAPLRILCAGTNCGSVRLFRWPLTDESFLEFALHGHKIMHCQLSPDAGQLLTACAAGQVCVSELKMCDLQARKRARSTYLYNREDESGTHKDLVALEYEEKIVVNSHPDQYCVIARAYWAELLGSTRGLEEQMENLKNETEYNLVQRETELQEKLRALENDRTREGQQATERYDLIVTKLGDTHRLQDEGLRQFTTETEAEMRQKDQEYEATLSQEYKLQDIVKAELEQNRDQNAKEVAELEAKYEAQLRQVQDNEEAAMSDWKAEYDKVCDLLRSDGLKFEVALQQTESEYKEETDFLHKKQDEKLAEEQDKATTALKESVSCKQNMGLTQMLLRTRGGEYEEEHSAHLELKERLTQSVRQFQKMQEELKAKEEEIRVKDAKIQKLKDSAKHLEGFRYVLFHKVQALEDEREPLSEQVSSLHESVKQLDAEFVLAFKEQQKLEEQSDDKDRQVTRLQVETQDTRSKKVQAGKDSAHLYQELLEVTATFDTKEIHRRLLDMLEKKSQFKVEKHEDGADPEKLRQITEEVSRQRTALYRKTKKLNKETENVKKARFSGLENMTNENCKLLDEIHQLRADRKAHEKKYHELQDKLLVLRMVEKKQGAKRHGSAQPSKARVDGSDGVADAAARADTGTLPLTMQPVPEEATLNDA